MDLVFKPFEAKSALKDQRALFRDCFPETIGRPAERDEHYFWKFHSYPAQPPSFEYGAYLGGELIGYYAAIPYEYKVGGDIRTAAMVCDVMTGSRARGRGVFTRLGSYSLDQLKQAGLDFTTGYPIRPEAMPGHLKVGWKIVQRMPVYVKVLKTNSILRSRKLGFLSFLGNAGVAALNLVPAIKPGTNAYTSEILTIDELSNDSTYPTFLQKWMKRVPNTLIKSGDFLRWRLGAPQTEYKLFVARDASGEIAAMCVALNTILEEIPSLALLDLMVLPGHRSSFRPLDKALRHYACRSGSEIIATMISKHWAKEYGLGSMGYLKSPQVFSLIVKKLNGALDDSSLYEAGQWHTMWIDSDDL